MDEKDENDKEKEMNNNIISNNTRNIKKIHYNNNFGLTKEQFELMKKIREEAITRTERYSDLISSNKSNDELIDTHKNKKKKINLIKSDTNSKSEKINLDNNSLGIGDIEDKNDDKIIDPNKERIFKKSQAFIFYKGEPIIIIGPDSQYYVWIFSTYTLLLVLNPGIPINKKDYDITKLQGNYRQCPYCNCISKDEIGRYTVHCEICKICVEYFDHHCAFTTKCIGKNNRIIFKMFLISIPLLFLVSFLYLIF